MFFISVLREFVHLLVGAGPCCRFTPCCSHYCRQAFSEHGFAKGFLLSVRRIVRCHPLSASGYDPVPQNSRRL